MNTETLAGIDLDALSASLEAEIATADLEEAAHAAEQAADAAKAQAAAPAEDEEKPEPEELPAPAHVPGTMKELAGNVTPEAILLMTDAVNHEFDGRIAFEQSKPAVGPNLVANLETARKRMTSEAAVRVFCAIDLDPTFINREISAGKRFNVYALKEKVTDLIVGLSAGFMSDRRIICVLTSMFRFQDAGVPFTGITASAAISDKIKVDRKTGALLTRHTVAANTAPTQQSQVMNALETLGIVTSNRQKGENEVFTLTDTPQTRALKEVLMK
ncbi:MAG: hypothetical protein DI537_13935 [Stutzerimonas stutzeri]|nr:MAG: hypothetical protein DI537_13935 [Stutzerimonas stutzeri]